MTTARHESAFTTVSGSTDRGHQSTLLTTRPQAR
jgi:hypothetical protein